MKSPQSDLRAAAEAATPGPWTSFDFHELHDGPFVGARGMLGGGSVFVCTTATDSEGDGIRDAAFIALASPDRILALLDENERLRGLLRRALTETLDYPGPRKWAPEARAALKGTK